MGNLNYCITNLTYNIKYIILYYCYNHCDEYSNLILLDKCQCGQLSCTAGILPTNVVPVPYHKSWQVADLPRTHHLNSFRNLEVLILWSNFCINQISWQKPTLELTFLENNSQKTPKYRSGLFLIHSIYHVHCSRFFVFMMVLIFCQSSANIGDDIIFLPSCAVFLSNRAH